MTEIIEKKKKILKELIVNYAYSKEGVILSSGKKSNYYIDMRKVTLMPEGAYLCASIMLDMIKNEKIDMIGGPTLGPDPITGAINILNFSAGKKINSFIIRKSAKEHGKKLQIEGPALRKGDDVVIIDDVATSGKSLLMSINVLLSYGVHVKKAVCIVDRCEGAREVLKKAGCGLISVFNISEIHSE